MKIVSGGQTGADQAGLDAAREIGLDYGGYVPRGRWTEDGPLPDDYSGMIETEGRHPATRTKLNVRESDATLIFSHDPCEGGTLLTLEEANDCRKPCLHIDLSQVSPDEAVASIRLWLDAVDIAGPRASKDPPIYAEAKAILSKVLGSL